MYRWCSYCQRLIGELRPFDDFRVTHGMCERCAARPDPFAVGAEALLARDLFTRLEAAGRGDDLEGSEAAVDEAIAAGLRPSDVIVGVLHPVLGRVARLWAAGAVSVADERRFSDFVLRLIDRLRFASPTAGRPLVLLAALPENRHDVGLRVLQVLSWERGIPCERLPVGTPMGEIVEAAVRRRPALVGLSVSLLESIPGALASARALRRALPEGTPLILGGQAFRRDDSPPVAGDLEVVITIDAFVARLDRLVGVSTGTDAAGGRGAATAADVA